AHRGTRLHWMVAAHLRTGSDLPRRHWSGAAAPHPGRRPHDLRQPLWGHPLLAGGSAPHPRSIRPPAHAASPRLRRPRAARPAERAEGRGDRPLLALRRRGLGGGLHRGLPGGPLRNEHMDRGTHETNGGPPGSIELPAPTASPIVLAFGLTLL